MPAAKTKGRFPGGFLAAIVVGVPLFIAPDVVRGLAAHRWVTHFTALEDLPRPRKTEARLVVSKVDTALYNLAPLPQASDAAVRALELGQRLENDKGDVEAALVIYEGVRAASVRAAARPLSGTGLAVIEARAAALEDSARRSATR